MDKLHTFKTFEEAYKLENYFSTGTEKELYDYIIVISKFTCFMGMFTHIF